VSRATPASPKSLMMCVARSTSALVIDASNGKAAKRSGDDPPGTAGIAFGVDEDLAILPAVKIWIDLTNSPHVLVMRPVIADLRSRGHEVSVTARDFAQTLGLCERLGIEHTPLGRHRGGGLAAKARGLAGRSVELLRWARGRGFDRALGHGSNDVTVAARMLRVRCATMFDYEWATVQHNVNCRLAQGVVVPDAIPPERLYRYGARGKIRAYPGLKEEYYLADFEPDPAVLAELGLDAAAPVAVIRTPPDVSLYHRFENDLFRRVLERLRGSQSVVLPRTPEQRAELVGAGGFIVPDRAIDSQSLIAYADLVVSAGGTMNREAVALGTPVFTLFEGKPGAVDERLIAEGRLRRLHSAEEIALVKRRVSQEPPRVRRDPALLTDLLIA
jgi:predicted glycosyltransferase